MLKKKGNQSYHKYKIGIFLIVFINICINVFFSYLAIKLVIENFFSMLSYKSILHIIHPQFWPSDYDGVQIFVLIRVLCFALLFYFVK